MDKEERAKYDCIKDKENLEKYQKSGRSFLYMTEKGKKELYAFIAIFSLEIMFVSVGVAIVNGYDFDKLDHEKQALVVQVDSYIKSDFKNMNCLQEGSFMEKYANDPSIYAHQEMKDWLKEHYDDKCTMKGSS